MAISSGQVLRYDTARLQSAAATLREKIQKAETSYENVKAETSYENVMTIVKNTERYWIGEAGNEHRNVFLEERDDIDQILLRLKEHPTDLLAIAGVAEQAAEKTKEIVSQPSVNLIY